MAHVSIARRFSVLRLVITVRMECESRPRVVSDSCVSAGASFDDADPAAQPPHRRRAISNVTGNAEVIIRQPLDGAAPRLHEAWSRPESRTVFIAKGVGDDISRYVEGEAEAACRLEQARDIGMRLQRADRCVDEHLQRLGT